MTAGTQGESIFERDLPSDLGKIAKFPSKIQDPLISVRITDAASRKHPVLSSHIFQSQQSD